MVVRRGQRLLAVLVCARHGKGLVAELLVVLEHAGQVLFEVPYLHLAGMQALVACLHHAYDLGEVFLGGRGVLGGGVGGWGRLALGGYMGCWGPYTAGRSDRARWARFASL